MVAELFGVDWLFWLQFPLLLIMAAVWALGGGALLWVGAKYVAKLPSVSFGRAVLAMLLAGVAGIVLSPLNLLFGLGVLVLIPVTWLIIMWILKTSFGKAILAWLPTLGMGIILIPLLISILIPSLARAREPAKRASCHSNLASIGKSVALYTNNNLDVYPPTFEHLILDGMVPKALKCPSAESDRESDYFYLAPANSEVDGSTIIACDLRINHKGVRNFLMADFSVGQAKTEQFQQMLQEPQNAEFAKALAAFEAGLQAHN